MGFQRNIFVDDLRQAGTTYKTSGNSKRLEAQDLTKVSFGFVL